MLVNNKKLEHQPIRIQIAVLCRTYRGVGQNQPCLKSRKIPKRGRSVLVEKAVINMLKTSVYGRELLAWHLSKPTSVG